MEGAQVARLSARCWGLSPRRAARQGPASAALGCAKATLSLWPTPPPHLVSSRGVAAEISSRGNYADPSRGSSPRPSSPPPPLCWGTGVGPRQRGGSGSLRREVVAGGRGAAGHQLTPPCDAVLRPVTPRAPRARARAPPRRAPCSCRDPRARRPHPSPRSIPASAGRWSRRGSSFVSSTALSWSAPKRSQRSRTSPVRSALPRCAPPALRRAQVSPRLGAVAGGGTVGLE